MLMMRAIFFSLALSLAVCVAAAAAPAAAQDDVGSSTLCVQKASTQAYDGVLAVQDGTGRLICWNKSGGQAWYATIDTRSGPSVLRVEDKPFLDLGSRVSQDAARGRGFAGAAVHSSGRLFVSYYTTVAPNGSAFLVVEELQRSASSNDVPRTRVFSMALPQVAAEPQTASDFALDYYCGQIMFRPTATDPFLYLVTGPILTDGQLQAKIMRFRMPSGNGINTPMEAELYAVVFGVPRRCAFDPDKPSDLYCAIVKEDQENVYLISDPDAPYYPAAPPSPSPLMENQRPTPGTPPSLVGGLLYRGYADKSMIGSYIYMDRSEFWVMETSDVRLRHTCSTSATSVCGVGSHTRNLRVTCSASAASACEADDFAGGTITSFGEDADKNAILLATYGVYLVVEPTLCNKAQPPRSTKKLLIGLGVAMLSLIAASALSCAVYMWCNCCNNTQNNGVSIQAAGSTINVWQHRVKEALSMQSPKVMPSMSSTIECQEK